MRRVFIAVSILMLFCSTFTPGLWPLALYAVFGAAASGPGSLPSPEEPYSLGFNIPL